MLTSAAYSRIFNSLPEGVQAAIAAYADAAEVPIDVTILVAIAHFLELESASFDDQQSRSENGSSILDDLPASLRREIKSYAAEDEMPPEFVVELAVVHFLDPDAVTFEDCLTGLRRDRLELLRQHKRNRQTTAA